MPIMRTFALTLAMLLVTDPIKASWAYVRNIPSGTRISVRMRDDARTRGYSVTKGHFESADESSLVLRTVRKRQTLLLPKSLVEQIRVRIPFTRRRMPWFVTGLVGGTTLIVLPYGGFRTPGASWGDDIPHFFALLGISITAGIAALTFGRGYMKTIYPVTKFNVEKIQSLGKLTSPPVRKGRIPN